ncbi:MAG: thioredoxin domain-containing protein [Patescibacteria group bacterium]
MDKTQVWIVGAVLLLVVIGIGTAVYFGSTPGSGNDTSYLSDQVADNDHVTGKGGKGVLLIEYSDFQCPACGAYHPVVKQLLQKYEDDIKFVYRHFPLPQHKNARIAAYASEAAGRQGKFFEMHDLLFENQSEWSENLNARSIFSRYAVELGLDEARFASDIDDASIAAIVGDQSASGISLGVNSTPTFFLNGKKLGSPGSLEAFDALIKDAIDKAPIKEVEVAEHSHADFAVYLDGKKIDFSLAKYQSEEGKEKNEWLHLHDGNGKVIHKHKKGVFIGEFFKSLGMGFTKECFTTDTGSKYCNGSGKTLKFFVNGKTNSEFGSYEPKDLDKLVISYGPKSENPLFQLESVSDDACIYSEKCPERGPAPEESCVGGLGTSCD